MKLFNRFITATLALALLAFGGSPVLAQGGSESFVIINTPLSVERDGNIPEGSFIFHKDGGITEVAGPNRTVLMRAKDSEAKMISTPNGPKKATHVYYVPSGSRIDHNGATTTVYVDNKRILTVVDFGRENEITLPAFDGWIEWTQDTSVTAIDFFDAKWLCPSAPPNPGAYVVDFLFNAITTADNLTIIQPVLEWNNAGSGRWTGAAWEVHQGGSYRATPINVNYSNTINGTMDWEYQISGFWYIRLKNEPTGQQSAFNTNAISTVQNLAVWTAFEGYNIVSDDDAPGDTIFDFMHLKYGSNTVDIDWDPHVEPNTPLTGLNVYIYSDNKVLLETAW